MNVCVSSLFIYIAKSQKIVILPTGEGCFDDWCKKKLKYFEGRQLYFSSLNISIPISQKFMRSNFVE